MKTLIQSRFSGKQQGFTLVEMSVVLLVIGLILGAVSIGKDVQRNAEYMKVKQKFLDQWASAYNDYYLRTGVVPADSQTAPRMMVNGALFTGASGVVSGGNMTAATGPVELCTPELFNEMDRTGVRMPPGRAEGSEDRYVYLDSNGNPQEIRICFKWNNPTTASGSGNMMVVKGLTPDLARTLDQAIDGKADAQEGLFRLNGVANGTAGGPGIEWTGNNTQTSCSSATTTATNNDEDQVCVFTAHYKMNQ